jgi:DNA polymerase/3'-5' exonuclease PolX
MKTRARARHRRARIASAAQARGWKWNPCGAGFTDAKGEIIPVKSERAVFELLGLDYLEPWERT